MRGEQKKPSPSGSRRRSTSLYLPVPVPAPKPKPQPKLIIMIHSFQQTRTQNHQHPGSSPPDVNHSFFLRHRHPLQWPWQALASPGPLPSRCPVLALACPPCPLPQIKEATAVNSVICATSLAVTLFGRHLCSEWGLQEAQSKRHRWSLSSRFRPAIHFRAASPTGCRLTEFTELIQSAKCSSNRHLMITR